jgi:HSP20 family protein
MPPNVPGSLHLLYLSTREAYQQPAWRPSADVYACRRGWLVKFDLAGVRLEDIELTVSDRRITVRGERRDWVVEEGQRFHSMEISYSRFERSIDLPINLERCQLQTEYRDGMLLVRVLLENCE